MATRKQAREKLVELFDAETEFTTVNGFMPIDLKGATKVLNIFARHARLDRPARDYKTAPAIFNLDVLVKRRGTVADEDDADELHQVVIQVVLDNPANAVWGHLELFGDTTRQTVEVAGVPYRLERHGIKVTLRI